MKGTEEISKSYYELFNTLMLYNHKIWRRMAMTLPANHCMVMYFLLHSSGHRATIAEFVEHLGISKQQMSPIVEKLVTKGFVEKKCLNRDRRYVQLSLTKEGMDFLEQNRKMQEELLSRTVVPLPPEKQEQFVDSVEQIKHLLTEMFKSSGDMGDTAGRY